MISPCWRITAARRNGVPGAIARISHRRAGSGRPSSRSWVNNVGSVVGAANTGGKRPAEVAG
ncbi:MAG: hypothetical protein ACRDRK_08975 [Pseudonocardia sp.]